MTSSIPALENWYALAVTAGREQATRNRIIDRLERANLKTPDLQFICPDEEVVVERDGDRDVKRRMQMPGYILVRSRRLTSSLIVNIKAVNGVMSFIGGDQTPQRLSKAEVARILGELPPASGGAAKKRPRVALWEIGQEVTMTGGPLAEFSGVIASINEGKEEAIVEVEIFGRITPTTINFRHLRRN